MQRPCVSFLQLYDSVLRSFGTHQQKTFPSVFQDLWSFSYVKVFRSNNSITSRLKDNPIVWDQCCMEDIPSLSNQALIFPTNSQKIVWPCIIVAEQNSLPLSRFWQFFFGYLFKFGMLLTVNLSKSDYLILRKQFKIRYNYSTFIISPNR